jgi:ribosomal protein L31
MPKKDIHPTLHHISMILPNGQKMPTLSTSPKDVYLDVYYKEAPAWTGGGVARANANEQTMQEYEKRFGNNDLFADFFKDISKPS